MSKSMIQKYTIFVLLTILFTACVKEEVNVFPDEPAIQYLNMAPTRLNLLDTTALIEMQFSFQDGDGDIGKDPAEEQMNIFLKDSRDTTSELFTYAYPFPYIPESKRPKGGLEGTVTMKLGREYFPPKDSLHIALGKDTLVLHIFIEDDAGNISNTITTDTIYVSM